MSKIDVSKCEYFKKLGKFNFCNKYDCNCGDFNCDFKYNEQAILINQLKEENEDLRRLRTLDRETRDRLIKEIEELKQYKSIINE